jgi:AraC-like DNA-binding protein
MRYYFEEGYAYQDYGYTFWEELKIPAIGYTVLPLTRKNGIYVIPLVTGGFLDTKSKNLMIIDIDVRAVSDVFMKNVSSGSEALCIYDNEENTAFPAAGGVFDEACASEAFVKRLAENKFFNYKTGGKTYLVVKSADSSDVFGRFNYFAAIPLDALMLSHNLTAILTTALSVLVCLLIMFIVVKFTFGLYSPFQDVMETNRKMEYKIKSVLPLACEGYLLAMLKSDGAPVDADINYWLKENGVEFTKDSFMALSVKLSFTEQFYEIYSHDEYLSFSKNIAEVFRTSVPEEYVSFVLTPKSDNLVILVNTTASRACLDEIVASVSHTLSAFDADRDYISVKIGAGNIGLGYEGLRRSFNQSQNVNAMQTAGGQNSLVVFNAEDRAENYFKYTIDAENKLYNDVMRKDFPGVKRFLEELTAENLRSSIKTQGIKLFYRQLYNTALRAVEAKGLSAEDFMGGKYEPLESLMNSKDETYIAEYVTEFLYEVASSAGAAEPETEADRVIEYIGAHFKEEICLEGVAETFDVSSKHLSRMIKGRVGISFGEYLARLRIDEAKRLLTTTKLTINDVIAATGFNSRNTFIRTFRKITNVLPSDYRNNFSNRAKM